MSFLRLLIVAFLFLSNHFIFAQASYEWILKPTYFRAENFKNGYGRGMFRGPSSRIIDKNGQEIPGLKSFPYQNRYFRNQKGQYQLTDAQLQPISAALYDDRTHFSEGISIVQKGQNSFGIDTLGRKIFDVELATRPDFYPFQEGRSVFRVGSLGHDLWGFVNNMGQVVCEAKYRYITNFSDGVAAFRSGSYWGVLDQEGVVRLAAKYDWINEFSEELATVRQNNRHGFINVQGEKVIPIMYRHAHSFAEGLAAVENDVRLWGFIDKHNQYVIRPQFAQAFSFHEGLARVENVDGKCGFIDHSGKLVIPYSFEDARDVSDSRIAVKMNGKWGYIKLTNPIKPKLEKRKLKSGKAVVVATDIVELQVFDYEQEDGDSISLYFNGQPILAHYRLTNAPKILHIELAQNRINQLVLRAHNLGKKTPNTASIKIVSDQEVQTVDMVSDLAENDILYFFRDQKDVSGKMEYTFTAEHSTRSAPNFQFSFKGHFIRIDSKGQKKFILLDNKEKNVYLCKDENGQKTASVIPFQSEGHFSKQEGRYSVLGYICRKAIFHDTKGLQTIIFYTTDLPFSYSIFEGIPGVVLLYIKQTPNGDEVSKATSIKFEPLDDSLFSLDGYEIK